MAKRPIILIDDGGVMNGHTTMDETLCIGCLAELPDALQRIE